MLTRPTVRPHAVVFFAVAALAPPAAAQTQTATEPVVVVSGEAIVKAPPDQAFVTIAAESRSKMPKEAQTANAAAMTAVQQKIVAAGISKDAIRTLAYDLQLESDWVNGRQVPRGYVARNSIEVRLDDITRVGEVIDLAVSGGATSVHNVRFDLKQRDMLEREALKRATADARARADAAASGAGRTIDRVIRIEEPTSGRPSPPVPMLMMREAAAVAAPPTPVAPGEIEIRATVTLMATLRN
jgi:uncharacterized protein YggE